MDVKTLETVRKTIVDAESQLTVLRADIDKAKKAGLDVTEQDKTYVALSNQVRRLKSVYS